MGGDQRRLIRPDHPHIRVGEDVVDVAGKEEADDKGGEKRIERPDEASAQLDQVVHQRRLGGVDVVLAHSAALLRAAGASGSASDAAWITAPAGSASLSAVSGLAISRAWRFPARRSRARPAPKAVSKPATRWRQSSRRRLRHVVAHHGDRIEARIDLRLVVDRLEFLLHALEVRLALDLPHGLHELALELGRHTPHLSHRLPDGAHHPRQVLRRNHRQSDNGDNDHLTDVKIEHGSPDQPAQQRQTAARRHCRRRLRD